MNYTSHILAINELSASEGVFTTAQARRFGIPADALSYASRAGRLERIAKGAYRLVGTPSSQLDELMAAWKLTAPDRMTHERIPAASWDGIAIGGSTAASILGIGDFHLSPYRIFAPQRINTRNKSVRFGVRKISRADVSIAGALPVTMPERTILDLWLDKEDPSLVVDALNDALRAYTHTFRLEYLQTLFVDTLGINKGEANFNSLFIAAGVEKS